MRQIRIKEIEEPDFGCEGRPQGESVFVKIWAEDAGTGEEDPGAFRAERKICRRSSAHCGVHDPVPVSSAGYYGPVPEKLSGREAEGI